MGFREERKPAAGAVLDRYHVAFNGMTGQRLGWWVWGKRIATQVRANFITTGGNYVIETNRLVFSVWSPVWKQGALVHVLSCYWNSLVSELFVY